MDKNYDHVLVVNNIESFYLKDLGLAVKGYISGIKEFEVKADGIGEITLTLRIREVLHVK